MAQALLSVSCEDSVIFSQGSSSIFILYFVTKLKLTAVPSLGQLFNLQAAPLCLCPLEGRMGLEKIAWINKHFREISIGSINIYDHFCERGTGKVQRILDILEIFPLSHFHIWESFLAATSETDQILL